MYGICVRAWFAIFSCSAWVALATLSGCVQDQRFDPSGCSLHIKGSWTVNGLSPTLANCGDIRQIALVVWPEEPTDFWETAALRMDCVAEDNIGGKNHDAMGFLDTTFNTGRCQSDNKGKILRPGIYNFQWIARADNGDILDCSALEEIDGSDPEAIASTIDLTLNDFEPEATGSILCP